MIPTGQNCTVKCIETTEFVTVDEKYNEVFCSECPNEIVSQEKVNLQTFEYLTAYIDRCLLVFWEFMEVEVRCLCHRERNTVKQWLIL